MRENGYKHHGLLLVIYFYSSAKSNLLSLVSPLTLSTISRIARSVFCLFKKNFKLTAGYVHSSFSNLSVLFLVDIYLFISVLSR